MVPAGSSEAVRAALRAGKRNVKGVAIAAIARRACGSDDRDSRVLVTAILAGFVRRGEAVRVSRGFYALADRKEA